MQINHSNLSDKASRTMISLVTASILAFFIWAGFADLDEIVRGAGEVVPSSNAQIIQNLEGGIVSKIYVREGDLVEFEQPLAQLSRTMFEGNFQELEARVIGLEAQYLRLQAELGYAETFNFPEHIRNSDPLMVKSELALFDARRNEYINAKASFEETIALHSQEVQLLENLLKKSLIPQRELITAQQALAEAKSNLNAMETEYSLARSEQLSEVLAELNQSRALLRVRKDQLKRTTILSPVMGIVNELSVSTIGGVVGPGDPIMELVPLEDELRVEARIRPEDVAFIRPGMRSTVKLSAYDYTVYGSLSGELVHVSADTFEDERKRDSEPYYKVVVAVDSESLSKSSNEIVIRPGMLADVELHTGEKTVLQYLLKPLFKASEAFQER